MRTTLAIALLLPASALAFVCSVPVVPLPLGPSNACCASLTLIPGAGAANPTGEDVYYGIKCTKATVKTPISSTQEDSNECPSGQKDACCDPTIRGIFGGGPCTMPLSS